MSPESKLFLGNLLLFAALLPAILAGVIAGWTAKLRKDSPTGGGRHRWLLVGEVVLTAVAVAGTLVIGAIAFSRING